jgi:hypothetical protein
VKQRNDFKVYEEKNNKDEAVWRVRTGGRKGDITTTCRTKEEADESARLLNIDPYHFERGYTRADRVASHTLAMKEKQARLDKAD